MADQNDFKRQESASQDGVPNASSEATLSAVPGYGGSQAPSNAVGAMPGAQPAPSPAPTLGTPPSQGSQLPTSGLAVASLVIGIVALVIVFIPVMNFASPIMGIVGLILAIAGMSGINNGKAKGKGMAVAGIVLNVITIVLALMITAACSAVLNSSSASGSSAAAGKPASASSAASAASAKSDASASASGAAAGDDFSSVEGEGGSEASADGEESSDTTSGASDKYAVSIDSAEVVADYNGDPALLVTYSWENNSDDDTSFLVALRSDCFQDGVQLETAILTEGMDEDYAMTQVKPGYGTTVQMAYSLKNTESPVEVEVSETFDFSKTIIASAKFDLE